MKIAISGSHGTGKSSFARGLAKKLGANYIHDIVTDEFVKEGFVINESTSPQLQIALVGHQWRLEQTTPQPWIADKCLFDYLVYARDDFKGYIKKTIEMFVKNDAHYDFVFYLPIEFPMEFDNIRSPDLNFQKLMDERYRKLLDDLGIRYIVLHDFMKESNSKEEAIKKRVELAMSYLKK